MRHGGLQALVAVITALSADPALASGPRYALVVGMNQGVLDAPGHWLPPLRFAQQEAARFRDALVSHARLEPERAVLVQGGDRTAILAGARKLAQLREVDRREYGELPSLFVLYFSGHGKGGRLLTAGAPLGADDIQAIRRMVGASLTVALFDRPLAACGEMGEEGHAMVTYPSTVDSMLVIYGLRTHAHRTKVPPQAARCLRGGATPRPPGRSRRRNAAGC